MSADDQSAGTVKCPTCGVSLQSTSTRCWLCGADISLTEHGEDRFSGPGLAAPTPELAQNFSLASLMMFVTLFAVMLGTITIAPGVGIPLAIVAFFAWLNTVAAVRRRAAKGLELTATDKILLFTRKFVSIVTLLSLLAVASGAALLAAAYTSCALDPQWAHKDPYVAYAFAAAFVTVLALFAFVMLIRYMLRRRRRERSERQ
jgi:hypothetical protein